MTGTWEDFEGDNSLTGFDKVAATILLKNELGGVSDGYELSHAEIGNSGYTFGGNQMDLGANPHAKTVLRDILINARDSNNDLIFADGAAFYDAQQSNIESVGSPNALSSPNQALINSALSSAYGKTTINTAFVDELTSGIEHINDIIDSLPKGNIKYLLEHSEALKAYLVDYHNQFEINTDGLMHNYLKGQDVTMYDDTSLQLDNYITLENIKEFIDHTKHGIDHPEDVDGRYDNVQETLGENSISENIPFPACHLPASFENLFELMAAPTPVFVDPLVLDLNGNGVELINLNVSNAYFDFNDDSLAENTGWVAPTDGLLVHDDDTSGFIEGVSELFGNNSTHGFTQLATYDSNSDDQITSADTNFSMIKVWKDADSDGTSDSGELHTLASLGITAISLVNREVANFNQGNLIAADGTFVMGGNTRTIQEVLFSVETSLTTPTGFDPVEINPVTLFLPFSSQYGELRAWHEAMSENEDLLEIMQDIVATQPEDFHTLTAQITAFLYEWADVTSLSPSGRGTNVDARQIAVMEKMMGQEVFSGDELPSNNQDSANDAWNVLFKEIEARILTQGPLKEVFPDAVYDFETGTLNIGSDIGDIEENAEAVASDDIIFWLKVGSVLLSHVSDLSGTVQSNTNEINDFLREKTALDDINTINHFLYGTDSANTINATQSSTFVYGADGNDTLNGGSNEYGILFGGDGNDTLNGGAGKTTLHGDAGDDTLNGGTAHDTYLFGLGDGHDTINAYDNNGGNTVRLGAGITASDIRFFTTNSGSDLNIALLQGGTETGDVLTLHQNGLHETAPVATAITLDDNSTIDISAGWHLKDAASQSSTITGSDGNDIIEGLNGNDTLNGGAGSDTLYGGDGNDTLNGNAGAGIFSGGAGDDTLNGGNSNDTFYFGLGDGHDTVNAFDNNGGNTVRLGAGITASDIRFFTTNSGSDLNIALSQSGVATGDVLTLHQNGLHETAPVATAITLDNNSTIDISAGWHLKDAAGQSSTITASDGNDTIEGLDGNDTINAGEGNDTLVGGLGADALNGGAGIDTVIYTDASTGVIVSLEYNESYYSTAEGDTFTSIENLAGSGYGDDLQGNSVANSIWGNGGYDTIIGWAGADTINGDAGGDEIYGGDDNDTINGNADGDSLYGNLGADVLYGGTGGDYLLADDYGYSDSSADLLYGEAGDDMLYSYGGADKLYGGDGNDSLGGGDGNNELYGEAGNDSLYAGNIAEIINGGADDDYLYYTSSTAAVNVDMQANSYSGGFAAGDTVSNIENISGSLYNDTITGNSLGNFLFGFYGNDTISGGDGADTIRGAYGTDILTGGAGADTFTFGYWDSSATYGYDTVTDFAQGSDKIQLTEYIADSFSDMAITYSGGDTIITENNNLFQITLDGTYTLTSSDFIFG